MILVAENGNLINMDRVVTVTNEPRYYRGGKPETGTTFRILAVGGHDENDFYPVADKLTESEANSLIVAIFGLWGGESPTADVPSLLRTIRNMAKAFA